MCGIVGAIAKRQVSEILLEGLRRLEYRGYDSAGIAIINEDGIIGSEKQVGKVSVLADELHRHPLSGCNGIAHTRWATHGRPSQVNAHPHFSADKLALVHNGIIENHKELREELSSRGYDFVSQTDTETIVHLIHWKMRSGLTLLDAVKESVRELTGAFGLAVISSDEPDCIVCARSGSPLVIGQGLGENFLASDQLALRPVTDRFIYLEEGDIAQITADSINIWDRNDVPVKREELWLTDQAESADKGRFRHYMLKEIFEQPRAIRRTLQGRLGRGTVLENAFGVGAEQIFQQLKQVQIVACGTSYHSGLVAKYWIEEYAGVPCQVEIASEFRYRKMVVSPDTLFVAISQSGETADTLAALRLAKQLGYVATLAICNVAQSSLVRESDLAIMTEAGPEIGVASTKAFTTQLTALLMLMIVLGRAHALKPETEATMVAALHQLPDLVEEVLELDKEIQQKAERFSEKKHALFLGRGIQYPVAMEGALKLKEISYIHAEAYPAGELKHGPLALVDSNMPIVAVAPNNDLLEKLKSNLEEVQARGGELFVFADRNAGFVNEEHVTVTSLPHVPAVLEPIVYSIPLQLLAYHAAILKGTDVDQPRNLAKSVTVE